MKAVAALAVPAGHAAHLRNVVSKYPAAQPAEPMQLLDDVQPTGEGDGEGYAQILNPLPVTL
jgi:hypothetical protein